MLRMLTKAFGTRGWSACLCYCYELKNMLKFCEHKAATQTKNKKEHKRIVRSQRRETSATLNCKKMKLKLIKTELIYFEENLTRKAFNFAKLLL